MLPPPPPPPPAPPPGAPLPAHAWSCMRYELIVFHGKLVLSRCKAPSATSSAARKPTSTIGQQPSKGKSMSRYRVNCRPESRKVLHRLQLLTAHYAGSVIKRHQKGHAIQESRLSKQPLRPNPRQIELIKCRTARARTKSGESETASTSTPE
jgi:hypothetical protein